MDGVLGRLLSSLLAKLIAAPGTARIRYSSGQSFADALVNPVFGKLQVGVPPLPSRGLCHRRVGQVSFPVQQRHPAHQTRPLQDARDLVTAQALPLSHQWPLVEKAVWSRAGITGVTAPQSTRLRVVQDNVVNPVFGRRQPVLQALAVGGSRWLAMEPHVLGLENMIQPRVRSMVL